MLADLLLHVLTPASRTARRLGLRAKSIALSSRAGRCRAAWAPHEARCHDVVCRAMVGLATRDTVLVLGSGLCRDVPLAELASAFRRVVLIDAVHPLRTRFLARRYPNVVLEARDLTGAGDWLLGLASGRVPPLADWQADPSVDLVISANLLSQLPLGLDDWLDARPSRRRVWGEDFADQTIDWHLSDLAGFGARVCLLTDTIMEERDGTGRSLDRLDLMRGRALPEPDSSWEWPVAPLGEVARGRAFVHLACGYVDFTAALGAGARREAVA